MNDQGDVLFLNVRHCQMVACQSYFVERELEPQLHGLVHQNEVEFVR